MIPTLQLAIAALLVLPGLAAAESDAPATAPDRAPLSGRARVREALEPPRHLGDAVPGPISTLVSSAPYALGPSAKPEREGAILRQLGYQRFDLELEDGTRVGGLLLLHPETDGNARPLVVASFGLLQDRWGSEAGKFLAHYWKDADKRLPVHLLVLDHPSAGSFFANNGHLSVGSYDDARMWIEVARHLKERIAISSIHLIGISMSGQTVVHALIEDQRLGLSLFDSALALSIAPDFAKAPGAQLSQLSTPEDVENPWLREDLPKPGLSEIQTAGVWLLFQKQFRSSYALAKPEAPPLALERNQLATFLRDAFERRVDFLREAGAAPPGWNADFRRDDLDAFFASTRIARVIDGVQKPLVLVNAADDPTVPRELFLELQEAAAENPFVLAFETPRGGHFGFDVTYGPQYLERIIRLMIDEAIVADWNNPAPR